MVPCLAFGLSLNRRLMPVMVSFYVLAGVLFILWLGYPIANISFGIMIAIHSASGLYFLNHLEPDQALGKRVAFSLAIMFVISQLIYVPVLNQVEKHLVIPLQMKGNVIVVKSYASLQSAQRGDWVVYRANGNVGMGYGIDRVLGVAGDRIHFTPESLLVNNVVYPRAAYMPLSGELVVPENQLFVWPASVNLQVHGPGVENQATRLLMQNAMVPERRFVGKPFDRWFWRRQNFNEPFQQS